MVRVSSVRRSVQLKPASHAAAVDRVELAHLHRNAPHGLRGLPAALGDVECAEPGRDAAGQRILQFAFELTRPSRCGSRQHRPARYRPVGAPHHHLRPCKPSGHRHRRQLDIDRRGGADGRRRGFERPARCRASAQQSSGLLAQRLRTRRSARPQQRQPKKGAVSSFSSFLVVRFAGAAATRGAARGSRSARAPNRRRRASSRSVWRMSCCSGGSSASVRSALLTVLRTSFMAAASSGVTSSSMRVDGLLGAGERLVQRGERGAQVGGNLLVRHLVELARNFLHLRLDLVEAVGHGGQLDRVLRHVDLRRRRLREKVERHVRLTRSAQIAVAQLGAQALLGQVSAGAPAAWRATRRRFRRRGRRRRSG